MEESIKELIEFIKNISPQVWAILIKQVYVEAFQLILWFAALTSSSAILFKLGKKFWAKHESIDYDIDWVMVSGASYVLSAVIGFIGLALIIEGISMLINPEYYAIKNIL